MTAAAMIAPPLTAALPPPGGNTQEVLFRRMLLQCSQRVVNTQQQQDDATDWRTDPKFHCIVEALQERLYDLGRAGPDSRPDPTVLQQYQAAVAAIATQLQQPQLPAYCLRVAAQDRLGPEGGSGLDSSRGRQQQQRASGSHSQQQQQASQPPQHVDEQAAGQHAAGSTAAGRAAAASSARGSSNAASRLGGGGAGAGGGSDEPSFSLSARGQQQVTTQQRLQDELTDELLDMGAELKSSTLAMQNAIRYRGKLLDDTETHLVHSTENAKAVAAKAKEQYRQGNWNLCHTLIIVLSVTCIFAFMLVFIRVSSLVGIKGN